MLFYYKKNHQYYTDIHQQLQQPTLYTNKDHFTACYSNILYFLGIQYIYRLVLHELPSELE